VLIGSGIFVRDLIDCILWLRRFRGSSVYPLVQLTNRFMNTRFGGRPRPHFEIVQWITLDPDGGMIPTDDPRQLPPVIKPANAEPELRTVDPPSVSEELNDEIPY
jgi:hypothetical protein